MTSKAWLWFPAFVVGLATMGCDRPAETGRNTMGRCDSTVANEQTEKDEIDAFPSPEDYCSFREIGGERKDGTATVICPGLALGQNEVGDFGFAQARTAAEILYVADNVARISPNLQREKEIDEALRWYKHKKNGIRIKTVYRSPPSSSKWSKAWKRARIIRRARFLSPILAVVDLIARINELREPSPPKSYQTKGFCDYTSEASRKTLSD